MLNRRRLRGVLAASALLAASSAWASDPMAYSPAAFADAQKAGRPILVHITAPWCTVCAAQRPILAKLEAEPRFQRLAVFDVDFDSQKEVVKSFGARMQSTLIGYKGSAETGRSAGETKPAAIEDLLAKTL